jgi:hypothetical protein
MRRALSPLPMSTWPNLAQRKIYRSLCRPCVYLQGRSHEALALHYLSDELGRRERQSFSWKSPSKEGVPYA